MDTSIWIPAGFFVVGVVLIANAYLKRISIPISLLSLLQIPCFFYILQLKSDPLLFEFDGRKLTLVIAAVVAALPIVAVLRWEVRRGNGEDRLQRALTKMLIGLMLLIGSVLLSA